MSFFDKIRMFAYQATELKRKNVDKIPLYMRQTEIDNDFGIGTTHPTTKAIIHKIIDAICVKIPLKTLETFVPKKEILYHTHSNPPLMNMFLETETHGIWIASEKHTRVNANVFMKTNNLNKKQQEALAEAYSNLSKQDEVSGFEINITPFVKKQITDIITFSTVFEKTGINFFLTKEGLALPEKLNNKKWEDILPSLEKNPLLCNIVGSTIHLACSVFRLINCKNVLLNKINPPEKLNKNRIKNGKLPLVSYHEIVLKNSKKQFKPTEGDIGYHNRIHLCRGHYKERKSGIYWWSQHIRGKNKEGKIEKSYTVKIGGK